ncbi:MAG: diaminopimelate decarboxylase [Planctomycetota bacterium]|nr:diaminopimelate decarboxylase [Planctomycetota bacterium]
MDHFTYEPSSAGASLHCEGVSLAEVAERFGSPTFVYSAATIREHVARFRAAFAPLNATICYAVKACNNLGVLRTLASAGAGADVVSLGELERALLAGIAPSNIVFAGVGKREHEIRAALDGRFSPRLAHARSADERRQIETRGAIRAFNAESEQEIALISRVARELGVRARVNLRVNPDIDPKTHHHTTTGTRDTKFGVAIEQAEQVFDRARDLPGVELAGLHVHLGSPIYSPEPYRLACEALAALMERLASRGHAVTRLDLGGGFGADYTTGRSPSAADYAAVMTPILAPAVARGVEVVVEPGRSIVANAGVLLTGVTYTKDTGDRRFLICDAGMNALLRPALYQAFHFIWPVRCGPTMAPPSRGPDLRLPGLETVDVVGPICETADFLARRRAMPPVRAGDTLAVFTAGAYGMSMASQYNDQPRPAEVLIDAGKATLVRRRESFADLISCETDLPG